MAFKKRLFLKGIIIVLLIMGVLIYYRVSNLSHLPKPYGHPYIPLPSHTYVPLTNDFPYGFDVSTQAVIVPQTEPYWITIYYPAFQAEVQITYKPVKNDRRLLHSYVEDSYQLCMKHQIRASSIESDILQSSNGITATFIRIKGQVPTPFQFYTTDGVHHFLRAAVYFSTSQENDYLAPIIEFIRVDMLHLLDTLHWKK